MLSWFILVPLLLLFVLNLPLRSFNRAGFWLSGALLLGQIVLTLLHSPLGWGFMPDTAGKFFGFNLLIDNLTLVMLLIIAIVGLTALLVGKSTLEEEGQRFNFVSLLLTCVIGMNAIVLVRDVFSLYVFIEITSIASFVMIALQKNKAAIEGTFKYLILSAVATVFMLCGMAFLLLSAGDMSFAAVHSAFYAQENVFLLKCASGLFLCGLLIKSGVMPFHGWVPDAYSSAPAAVSVLLAGITTKVAGVYVLLRLFGSVFVLNPQTQNILMAAGALSIVLAALAALTQDDFKRMLSYSSISQVGYIILALGCATPLAFAGAVFHFFNHAVFKSLLFVNAASLEKRFGSTNMNTLAGVKSPLTGFTSLIGSLSTAGIPPLSGFWSKLIIIIALFTAGKPLYAALALLASLLTLAYFLSFQRRVFFCKAESTLSAGGKSASLSVCEISLALVTALSGLIFVFAQNNWVLPLKAVFW